MSTIESRASGQGGMATADIADSGRGRLRLGPLHGPELLLGIATLLVLAATLALSQIRGQAVAWDRFAVAIGACAGLTLVGLLARGRPGMARPALFAVSFGLYSGFAALATILIYLAFPIVRPLIDARLFAVDARLGYSWIGLVGWLAEHPKLSALLAATYRSSLLQLVAMLAFLSLTGRQGTLHRFMATSALTLAVTFAVWVFFPSFGPAFHLALPPETARAAGLVVNEAYAAEMRRLASEGIAVITPETILGVIAFPSYHSVMACLVVFYAWGTRAVWPAIALNVAMGPAILAHGGHHLVDVLAGVAVFAAAANLSARLVRGEDAIPAA